MATAAIVISQQGKPQAVPGQSRADLSAGAKVVLTNNDNTDVGSWTWELSPPPGSKAALSGGTNPVASFTPDVPGSYIVEVTLGGPGGALSDRRVAAVGTPFLGLRKPSAAERCDFDPVQNQWSAVQEAFDLIDADAARGLKADGSNSPTADIRWKGHRITELGGLELEGPLRLGKSGDPEAVEGKAFLYLKEIGGGLDLFYCAPDGSSIRLIQADDAKFGPVDQLGGDSCAPMPRHPGHKDGFFFVGHGFILQVKNSHCGAGDDYFKILSA